MQNTPDITFDDLKALARGHAPDLAQSIILFAQQAPATIEAAPEGSLSVIEFEAELRVAQAEYDDAQRRMKVALLWRRFLTQTDPPPNGNYLLADFLVELYEQNSEPIRASLVELAATAPFVRGLWGGLKRIYKLAEERQDALLFGAIIARINSTHMGNAVTRGTLIYLQRRGWRYLRNMARAVPEMFPTFALATLQQVREDVAVYSVTVSRLLFDNNEFVEAAWKLAPDPLMVLLETAEHNEPAKFAITRLKRHFPAELKRANVDWLKRLAARPAPAVHELVVEILKDLPEFHSAKLEGLGLKSTVLSLLLSPSPAVCKYAVEYARSHAADLPHADLVHYAVRGRDETRTWALSVLDGAPAKTLGLAHLSSLLAETATEKWAAKRLSEQFDRLDFPDGFFVDLAYGAASQRNWARTYLTERDKRSEALAAIIKAIFADPRRSATTDDASAAIGSAIQAVQNLADIRAVTSYLNAAMSRDGARGFPASGDIIPFVRALAKFVEPQHLGAEWLLQLAVDQDYRPFAETVLRDAKTLPDLDVEAVKGLVFDRRLRELMLFLLSKHASFKAIGLPWLLALARRTDPQLSNFATHMLLGKVTPNEFGDGDVARGVTRLVELATGAKEPDAVRAFAQTYLRCHHPVIGQQQPETATYAIEPKLTLENYQPEVYWKALDDPRADVRRFAVAVTKAELRRWGYHSRVYELADSDHRECRLLCLDALRNAGAPTADMACTLQLDELVPEEVFRLTESRNRESRETAMGLISEHYDRLGGAERLAWLMASADRGVRTMAVRMLWERHRPPTLPADWKPKGPANAPNKRPTQAGQFANVAALQEFLRMLMFGLPPGRNPEARDYDMPRRHLSAQAAKRHAIDAACSLGQDDESFARTVAPLFMEFTGSIARGEWQSCLAALTKLKVAHPELDVGLQLSAGRSVKASTSTSANAIGNRS